MESFNAIDYALSRVRFASTGVICPDSSAAPKLHKFLREAILDNHIPIRKIAGFKVIAGKKMDYAYGDTTRLSHHPALGESYPELARNMLDKVLCTPINGKTATFELQLGKNTADRCIPKLFGTTIKMLYTNPAIATHIGDDGTFAGNTSFVNIQLHVELTTGYRSYADNSKIIPNEYFPCATDASLADYVRVLPPMPGSNENIIAMRYFYGFTPEDLVGMIREWKSEIERDKLPKGELEWVQSFTF